MHLRPPIVGVTKFLFVSGFAPPQLSWLKGGSQGVVRPPKVISFFFAKWWNRVVEVVGEGVPARAPLNLATFCRLFPPVEVEVAFSTLFSHATLDFHLA